MQRAANSGSIIKGLSSVIADSLAIPGQAALYKHLGVQLIKGAYSERLFIDLGNKLLALAEQAYSLRQLDRLGEVSQALRTLPFPAHYESAARYFRGLELLRKGDLDAAESVLEAVLADPPHRYTARALQSLGVIFTVRGDLESALKLHIEAGDRSGRKGSIDLLTTLFVQRNIAVLKSVQGDHRGALNDLERMVLLTKTVASVHPPVYYDYLNSLAVELAETGRVEEAARISRIVISAPFSNAYPEWRQTYDDIALKERQRASRSAVAIRDYAGSNIGVEGGTRETNNLFRLPSAKRPTGAAPVKLPPRGKGAATILDFQNWKTIAKASSHTLPQEVAPDQRNRMTIGEKLIRLMDLISHDQTDDETIDRILEAVEQIVPKHRGDNLH